MTKETMIEEIKIEIEKQKTYNEELYKSIPTASKEDPLNKKAEPILERWREGSKRIKKMIAELQNLENMVKETKGLPEVRSNKIFVNGFGEATKRDIVSETYNRAEKRRAKEIMSFIGR